MRGTRERGVNSSTDVTDLHLRCSDLSLLITCLSRISSRNDVHGHGEDRDLRGGRTPRNRQAAEVLAGRADARPVRAAGRRREPPGPHVYQAEDLRAGMERELHHRGAECGHAGYHRLPRRGTAAGLLCCQLHHSIRGAHQPGRQDQ